MNLFHTNGLRRESETEARCRRFGFYCLDFVPFSWLNIGDGSYGHTDELWFVAVGIGLFTTMILQTFAATLMLVLWSFIYAPLSLRMHGCKAKIQDSLNGFILLPEWNLSLRVVQSLNIMFVMLMYAGGIHILYFGHAVCTSWVFVGQACSATSF